MNNWASAIIIASVLCALAIYVMPDSANSKTITRGIRFIGGLVILCIMLSPVKAIFEGADELLSRLIPTDEISGGAEGASTYDALVRMQYTADFEAQTATFLRQKTGRDDFRLETECDEITLDIKHVKIIFQSDDFPVEYAQNYIFALYSETIPVSCVKEGTLE